MLASLLSPVQDQVIAALANGASISAAAGEAKIHRNTIGNWRRSNATFRAAIANALYDRALLIREQAEGLAACALDTVREILTDSKAAPAVRLKAALAILNHASTPPPAPPEPALIWNIEPPPPPAPERVHNNAQLNPETYMRIEPRTGRNEPCPCGSGRKFKLCCLNKPKPGDLSNLSVTGPI